MLGSVTIKKLTRLLDFTTLCVYCTVRWLYRIVATLSANVVTLLKFWCYVYLKYLINGGAEQSLKTLATGRCIIGLRNNHPWRTLYRAGTGLLAVVCSVGIGHLH
ncbi:hypothetical protein GQ600_7758 [Phytophthora cactorum]|nr:hypothetical protein GQ600_7758 [Phytophthora cactorum]